MLYAVKKETLISNLEKLNVSFTIEQNQNSTKIFFRDWRFIEINKITIWYNQIEIFTTPMVSHLAFKIDNLITGQYSYRNDTAELI